MVPKKPQGQVHAVFCGPGTQNQGTKRTSNRGARSTVFTMDAGAGKSCCYTPCDGPNCGSRTAGRSNPRTGSQTKDRTSATRKSSCRTPRKPDRLAAVFAPSPSVCRTHTTA